MKKKMTFAAIAAVAALSSYMGLNANSMAKESSALTLANIEAEAGWSEYWDRLDYDCETITCYCLTYTYNAESAVKVGEGCGSVAHWWSCGMCGGCIDEVH